MSDTLILGATGNVGSALANILNLNQRSHRGGRQFEGATELFLVTPFSSEAVELTKHYVSEAKRVGIQKIVKLSALGADPKSSSRILRLHGEAEEIVRESGIPCAFIRPNAFMQNFIQHYGSAIRSRSAISVPARDSKVSFVDTQDVARVAYLAFLPPQLDGQVFEVTGAEPLSFEDAARLLSSVLGREIRYVPTSEEETRDALMKVGVPEWRREALLELYGTYRDGLAEKIVSQPFKMTTLTEFFKQNQTAWGIP